MVSTQDKKYTEEQIEDVWTIVQSISFVDGAPSVESNIGKSADGPNVGHKKKSAKDSLVYADELVSFPIPEGYERIPEPDEDFVLAQFYNADKETTIYFAWEDDGIYEEDPLGYREWLTYHSDDSEEMEADQIYWMGHDKGEDYFPIDYLGSQKWFVFTHNSNLASLETYQNGVFYVFYFEIKGTLDDFIDLFSNDVLSIAEKMEFPSLEKVHVLFD